MISNLSGRQASRQHRWKAGGSVGSSGYVKLRVGKGHPLADPNGYTYEHLVVWVSAGNCRPSRDEILHHINNDKTDNRLENLQVMTRAEHNRLHNLGKQRCPNTGRFLRENPEQPMTRVGKKAAGRTLDGRTWDEAPR